MLAFGRSIDDVDPAYVQPFNERLLQQIEQSPEASLIDDQQVRIRALTAEFSAMYTNATLATLQPDGLLEILF